MSKDEYFQENKHKSRKQDKIGKSEKYEKHESSEKKESQKRGKIRKGKAKQRKESMSTHGWPILTGHQAK